MNKAHNKSMYNKEWIKNMAIEHTLTGLLVKNPEFKLKAKNLILNNLTPNAELNLLTHKQGM